MQDETVWFSTKKSITDEKRILILEHGKASDLLSTENSEFIVARHRMGSFFSVLVAELGQD